MNERPHGYARYRLDGCRCYVCAFARSQYDDNRNRAVAYGTWRPWADAEPVRIHIRHLQSCSMGLRAIAAAAGVDRKRLQAIITGRPERGTGPQEKVRPALAAAVLAVEPTLDNLPACTVIGATGTARRLQALITAGWPQHHLAVRLGMSDANFAATLHRERVVVRTVRAVRGLYDALWRADPREHGVAVQRYSRARAQAAANGWAPVGAWDDDTIDDPAAFPDWTGRCGTPAGDAAHRRLGQTVCQPCLNARAAVRREAGAAA
ncbi:hypothetical protein OEIGOIKO_05824 [Streptomyces chrestomyceticus JCM 4735]|uniref:Uncharacterized protein n=1 Tax=Streptomyces chrestomyceticus JCM 4735 TaxID=1306181 RepID=A0A7U9KZ07_9ACTN|nr:hypothetical protein [Streptomyces chrestomyceticus]GCD38014.1 hypothetical protein OEIGOIKO_05824 [Streptomyces chrestomyceticus JCM 4735]